MTDLKDIFAEYTAGSQGFCIAVEAHCGYSISRSEIERIAEKAWDIAESSQPIINGAPFQPREVTAAKAFSRIWETESWWCDA